MMYRYPYDVTRDGPGWLITFPDLPAVTDARREADIPRRAREALWTILDFYIRDRRPLPPPSAGPRTVVLPPLVTAKLALHQAMVEQGVTKAKLAARLDAHSPQVDRLLDLKHASTLDRLEAALRAVNRELLLEVRAAAPPPTPRRRRAA